MEQQTSTDLFGVVGDEARDDRAGKGAADGEEAQIHGMSANSGHDTFLDKCLAAVKKLELSAKMGGVLGKALLLNWRSNINCHGMDVGKAELLKTEEQIGAVQAAAEHSYDRRISALEPRKLLETLNGLGFLGEGVVDTVDF